MKVPVSWEQINQQLLSLFSRAGLQVRQSFDLKLAREGLPNPEACTCPHHGTETCSCQYMVYLLYDHSSEPLTLVLHGYDRWTHVYVEPGPSGGSDPFYQQVKHLLAIEGIA